MMQMQDAPIIYLEADGLTISEREDGALVLILTQRDGAALGLPLLQGMAGALRAVLDAADVAGGRFVAAVH